MGLDAADKVWKKDETAALIALYESEKILYDKKDKHYNNVQKRNNGFERIRQVMLRIRPGCTVADIKSRIKYLRSQYTSELLRRNISVESGLCTEDTYKPVMWCFGLLQFLDDYISTKKNTSKIDISEEEKSEEPDTEDDNASTKSTSPLKRKLADVNSKSSSDVSRKAVEFEAIRESKSRKRKKEDGPSSSESSLDSQDRISGLNNFDREDIFGQYVASELRALRDNPLLYLQTKQSILEVLTSANFDFINPE